jgi:hypothetical protein
MHGYHELLGLAMLWRTTHALDRKDGSSPPRQKYREFHHDDHVRYVPVSLDSYRQVLATVMPADVAQFLSELFAYILDGHNAFIDGDIERVLGRKARDFRSYAQGAAAAGAWPCGPR